MRITIDIDDKSGNVSTNSGTGSGASANASGANSTGASAETPPPDVLALAAATGAINGGPAPTVTSGSAPHPFISRGGGMLEQEHAQAISAGSAAQAKPC